MPQAVKDYKFWLGLSSFALTAAGIVFFGGKTVQKQDTIIEVLGEIRHQLPAMDEKINKLRQEVDILKVEFKHLPTAKKTTADNLPLWKYEE